VCGFVGGPQELQDDETQFGMALVATKKISFKAMTGQTGRKMWRHRYDFRMPRDFLRGFQLMLYRMVSL
jgi:hypothetical protein